MQRTIQYFQNYTINLKTPVQTYCECVTNYLHLFVKRISEHILVCNFHGYWKFYVSSRCLDKWYQSTSKQGHILEGMQMNHVLK